MAYLTTPIQLDLFLTQMHSRSYHDGYESGVTWDASWVPGGPYVYNESSHPTPQQVQKIDESRQRHAEWMRGWHDGLKVRLQDGTAFGAWWEAHKGARPHMRYVEEIA